MTLVVHLAAKAGVRPSIEDPLLYSSVNIDGTWQILEWMRSRGIPHLVFASSSSVYGNCDIAPFREDVVVDRPISPYAATKLAGELACQSKLSDSMLKRFSNWTEQSLFLTTNSDWF